MRKINVLIPWNLGILEKFKVVEFDQLIMANMPQLKLIIKLLKDGS